MKKIFLGLFCAVLAFGLSAQEKDKDAISTFFKEYQESEKFTSVYISPKMFEMFAQIESEEVGEEVKRVLNNIKGLRILSTEEDGVAIFKESKNKLINNSFEVLMTVQEEENNVEFLIKDDVNGNIQELLLLVGGVEGFTMLSFIGDISISDLSKLASKMEINGLEHLEKLEDK